jgi:hypothetical protein
MRGLRGKPLEPNYVSATFTDTLGDPTERLVEIAQEEFLRSEVGEEGLDQTMHPPGTHHLVVKRCYFSSNNASAKSRPSSWFSLSQQDNCSNTERKANIVEVVCLAEDGSPIPGWTSYSLDKEECIQNKKSILKTKISEVRQSIQKEVR